MGDGLSTNELKLAVEKAVLDCVDPATLLMQLFNKNVSDTLRRHVIAPYAKCAYEHVRDFCRKLISARILAMDSEFITKFRAAQAKNQVEYAFEDIKLGEWSIMKWWQIITDADEKWARSLGVKLKNYFHQCCSRYLTLEKEAAFREVLVEYLTSGEMTHDIYHQFLDWSKNGASLKALRETSWKTPSSRDKFLRKLCDAMAAIEGDEFLERDELAAIIRTLLSTPSYNITRSGDAVTLELTGRTIFLSDHKESIEEKIASDKLTAVAIYTHDVCSIDVNLDGDCWKGKNFVISSAKIYVWKEDATIDLSGHSFNGPQKKARNARDNTEKGVDGEHGLPGESSGNIALLAREMVNPQRLNVLLNGGAGEHGQHGGDGANGVDGVDAILEDFEAAIVKYGSIYWGDKSLFYNYDPPNCETLRKVVDESKGYVYGEYKDSRGRLIYYSLASDPSFWMTTYELYFLMTGTEGTAGSIGGKNGCGGEGGYRGEFIAQNTATGEKLTGIRCTRTIGASGRDGEAGKSGSFGRNGCDMGRIDRSRTSQSKWPYGEDGRFTIRPEFYYYNDDDTHRRFDGHKKYVDGKEACYMGFTKSTLDDTVRYAQTPERRTQKTNASKAVCKAAIVVSEILTKAATVFKDDEAVLSEAFKIANRGATTDRMDEVHCEKQMREQVEEQVTVVRDRDAANDHLRQLTHESEQYSYATPNVDDFIAACHSLHRATFDQVAQWLFDLFMIELDQVQLGSLCNMIKSKFDHLVDASLQSKLINGKSFTDIELFKQNIALMVKRKQERVKLAKSVENVLQEYFRVDAEPKMDIDLKAQCVFAVTYAPISKELNEKFAVESIIGKFFAQYQWNSATLDLLRQLWLAFKELQRFEHLLTYFKQPSTFIWADPADTEPFLATLIVEEEEDNTRPVHQNNTVPGAQNTTFEATSEPKQLERKKRLPTPYDRYFADLKACIDQDYENLNNVFAKLKTLINANEVLKARFGEVPKFHSSGYIHIAIGEDINRIYQSNDQCAKFLIRFYWQAKALLVFNMHLYNLNTLYTQRLLHLLADSEHAVSKIPDTEQDLAKYMINLSSKPIATDGDGCENHMRRHGLNSAAFRYLAAVSLDVNIRVYRFVGQSTACLVESLHESSKRIIMLASVEEAADQGYRVMQQLVADPYRRHLAAAQEQISSKYNEQLDALMHFSEDRSKVDYTDKDNALTLAKYLLPSVREAAIEWLHNLTSVNNTNLLIAHLHDRFELDGCHLTLLDLQFLLSSFAYLRTECNYSAGFLLFIADSVPQSKLVDVFVYLRVESKIVMSEGDILDADVKEALYNAICEIPKNRLKTLFATKLDGQVEKSLMTKLLLMLRHAADGSERLETIPIGDWIDIAKKQKWSNIGHLLQTFGSVGYYLAFLESRERPEEVTVRALIERAALVPEKLIARVAHLIANNEVDTNADYFAVLERLLTTIGDKFKHYLKDEEADTDLKYPMLRNELNQNRLLAELVKCDGDALNAVIPTTKRHVDVLRDLIVGMNDVKQEDKYNRRLEIYHIAELLKTKSSESSKLIDKVDDVLYEKRMIRLRDTQKMAVMCAVESDSNVLEQVNTGEGKSFIIATLAILRAKLGGHKNIDIITSSGVLAQRDAVEMADLYAAFGLTVAHNCDEDVEKRKMAYKATIVYGDIARFQRDHLLHTFYKRNILGDRVRDVVIVDEVDNMVLDNANNMLYLSHSVPGLDLLDALLIFIHREVHLPLFNGEHACAEDLERQFDSGRIKLAVLADLFGQILLEDLEALAPEPKSKSEVPKVYERLIELGIIDADGYLLITDDSRLKAVRTGLSAITRQTFVERVDFALRMVITRERKIHIPRNLHTFVRLHIDEFIENCKRALFLQAYDEYVVDVDHTGTAASLSPVITIVDKNTGVDLATSQWSGGLHQFIQLKHGCRLAPISLKAVFISNVSYLKGYKRINGFSGTLGSLEESKTLVDLYDADPIKIPTWEPKKFYEHVPIISTSEEEWIKSIYDEVRDQALADRSVLIICKSIAEVQRVKNALLRMQESQKCPVMKNCLEYMLVYQREHEDFNLTSTNSLAPRQLIIATNLAGRGTDIKLSKELIDAGGLHVIVSFLPDNCRIEEQAYGRAARCGEPGSGQIMALIDQNDRAFSADTRPSVFQLKQFRDNAEVHRLHSLKRFYEYHTAIEERCLEEFLTHCDKALTGAYSSTTTTSVDDSNLPTAWQTIYFALLDEWALWLDTKADLIRQCSKTCSDSEKEAIIASVKDFLHEHPIDNLHVAQNWIRAPQSLIALVLVEEDSERGIALLKRVLRDHPEFAAEANYYMGCITYGILCTENPFELAFLVVQDFANSIERCLDSALPSELTSLFTSAPTHPLHAEFFWRARSQFADRLERRRENASIVTRLLHYMGPSQIRVTGFADQQKHIDAVYECVMSNIDWLLGAPCQITHLEEAGLSESDSHAVWDALCHQGVITPPMLNMSTLDEHQLAVIRRRFFLSKKTINSALMKIADDQMREEFDGQTVVEVDDLKKYIKLANRLEFWNELCRMGCLQDEEHYIIVDPKHESDVPLLDELKPIDATLDPDGGQFRIYFSNSHPEMAKFYKADEVVKMYVENKMEYKLRQLLQWKFIEVERTAIVNIFTLHTSTYFNRFDCVTAEDLADYFEIDAVAAKWILQVLVDHEILLEQNMLRHCVTEDAKLPAEDVLVKFTDALHGKENLNILLEVDNVSVEVLASFCEMSNADAEKLHAVLEKAGVLKKSVETVYRLKATLDCSLLPACLRDDVDNFLSDRLAYTFAFETLAQSIRDSVDCPKTEKIIFLPLDPYSELHEELIKSGVIQAPHTCQKYVDLLIDYEDYDNVDAIKKFIGQYSAHIDKANSLIPTLNYLTSAGVDASADSRAFVANGVRQLMGVREINTDEWWVIAAWTFVGFVCFTAMAMFSFAAMPIFGPIALLLAHIAASTAISALAIAAYGSYRYYQQVRAAIRRVRSMRAEDESEFIILREYNGAAKMANENTQVDSLVTKTINQSVGHGAQILESELLKITSKAIKFSCWSPPEHIPGEVMSNTLSGSPNVKALTEEVAAIASSTAMQCRRVMYDLVKEHVDKPTFNETAFMLKLKNAVLKCAPKLDVNRIIVIQDVITKFVDDLKDAMDGTVDMTVQFFDGNATDSDDDDFDLSSSRSDDDSDDEKDEETISDDEDNEDDTEQRNEQDATPLDKWKKGLILLIEHTIKSEVRRSLFEPTVRTLTNYVRNARSQLKPINTEKTLIDKDHRLKKLLGDGARQAQLCIHTIFLCEDMQHVLRAHLTRTRDLQVFANMVKFGYKLPIECAPTIANALDLVLEKRLPNYCGLEINFIDSSAKNKLALKHRTRPDNSLNVKITFDDDHFFVALVDYKATLDVNQRVSVDDVNSRGLFEAVCTSQNKLEREFVRAHESFREELAQALLELVDRRVATVTRWYRGRAYEEEGSNGGAWF